MVMVVGCWRLISGAAAQIELSALDALPSRATRGPRKRWSWWRRSGGRMYAVAFPMSFFAGELFVVCTFQPFLSISLPSFYPARWRPRTFRGKVTYFPGNLRWRNCCHQYFWPCWPLILAASSSGRCCCTHSRSPCAWNAFFGLCTWALSLLPRPLIVFFTPSTTSAHAATPTSYPGRVQRNVHNVTGFLSWLLAGQVGFESAQDTGNGALADAATAATAAISLENFSTTFGQLPGILPRPLLRILLSCLFALLPLPLPPLLLLLLQLQLLRLFAVN